MFPFGGLMAIYYPGQDISLAGLLTRAGAVLKGRPLSKLGCGPFLDLVSTANNYDDIGAEIDKLFTLEPRFLLCGP